MVFTRKPKPDNPKAVRARCVAQEHNVYKRDDVSQATPTLKIHRMIISYAATRTTDDDASRKLIGRWGISVAFFHAASAQKIAVRPPKDVDIGFLWFLLKAMNGAREASKQWGDEVTRVTVDIGGSWSSTFAPARTITESWMCS